MPLANTSRRCWPRRAARSSLKSARKRERCRARRGAGSPSGFSTLRGRVSSTCSSTAGRKGSSAPTGSGGSSTGSASALACSYRPRSCGRAPAAGKLPALTTRVARAIRSASCSWHRIGSRYLPPTSCIAVSIAPCPDLVCGNHVQSDCDRCERLAIVVLPALAADNVVGLTAHDRKQLAPDAYRFAVPLEDLVATADEPVLPLGAMKLVSRAEELPGPSPVRGTGSCEELLQDPERHPQGPARSSLARRVSHAERSSVLRSTWRLRAPVPALLHPCSPRMAPLVCPPMRGPSSSTTRTSPPPDGLAGIAVIHV